MKNLLVILILLVAVNCSVFAQQKVNARPVKRQLESMVILKWNKRYFRPQWYYWLMHNKYRKGEDRRTMLQLLPALAFVDVTKNASNDQKDDTKTVFDQEVAKSLNILTESHYHLYYKSIFDQLFDDIDGLLLQCLRLDIHEDAVEKLGFERMRLENQLEIIRDGYLSKGDSANAMSEIEGELRKLKGTIIRLIEFKKISKKYEGIN